MTSEGIRATTHFLLSSHSSLRMLTIAFLTLLCASASATESKWEAWSLGLDQGKTAACTAGSQGFQRLTWGGGNWVVGGRGVMGRNWALRGFPSPNASFPSSSAQGLLLQWRIWRRGRRTILPVWKPAGWPHHRHSPPSQQLLHRRVSVFESLYFGDLLGSY